MTMNLITGKAGAPHITSSDQGAMQAGLVGNGNYLRISQQQSFPPPLHPHPLLFPQKDPFPQQERRRMIQIIELHPHPLSVEHPQFVAVKSLISDLQINIFTV